MGIKITVGIDPDLHNSGFAIMKDNCIEFVKVLPLWDIFEMLIKLNKYNQITVLLEFPRNTNTYHAGGKGAALNVGKNQAIAIVLKDFLLAKKIKFKLLYPNGYSTFFKNESFFKLQTGYKFRTNKDGRAAAAMVFLNKI